MIVLKSLLILYALSTKVLIKPILYESLDSSIKSGKNPWFMAAILIFCLALPVMKQPNNFCSGVGRRLKFGLGYDEKS